MYFRYYKTVFLVLQTLIFRALQCCISDIAKRYFWYCNVVFPIFQNGISGIANCNIYGSAVFRFFGNCGVYGIANSGISCKKIGDNNVIKTKTYKLQIDNI